MERVEHHGRSKEEPFVQQPTAAKAMNSHLETGVAWLGLCVHTGVWGDRLGRERRLGREYRGV